MPWLTIREYCKKKGIKSPQIIYNKIYMGKMKKDKEWREVKITKTKVEIFYE